MGKLKNPVEKNAVKQEIVVEHKADDSLHINENKDENPVNVPMAIEIIKNNLLMKVKKILPNAKIPTKKAYNSNNQLGIDFFAAESVRIPAKGFATVRTGVAVQLSDRKYGILLKDKSGIAVRKGLHIMGGVIDGDYTGEILAILFNASDTEQKIYEGDQCVQGVVTLIYNVDIKEVKELDATERGDNGFGSSYNENQLKSVDLVGK